MRAGVGANAAVAARARRRRHVAWCAQLGDAQSGCVSEYAARESFDVQVLHLGACRGFEFGLSVRIWPDGGRVAGATLQNATGQSVTAQVLYRAAVGDTLWAAAFLRVSC